MRIAVTPSRLGGEKENEMRWRIIAVCAPPVAVAVAIAVWVVNAHIVNHLARRPHGHGQRARPVLRVLVRLWIGPCRVRHHRHHRYRRLPTSDEVQLSSPRLLARRQSPRCGRPVHALLRHHPDYQGKRPTGETIARLHREYSARQVAIHDKLQEVHRHCCIKQSHSGWQRQQASTIGLRIPADQHKSLRPRRLGCRHLVRLIA
jgi:hypothetical protein